MDRCSKELAKDLAKRHNLSLAQVENALAAPFRFQKHVMTNLCDRESCIFPSLRIPNLGIFHVPEYILNKLKLKNRQDELISDEELEGRDS